MEKRGLKELERILKVNELQLEKTKFHIDNIKIAIVNRKNELSTRGNLVDLKKVNELKLVLDNFNNRDGYYGFTIIGLDDAPLLVLCGKDTPESFYDEVYEYLVKENINLEVIELEGDVTYDVTQYSDVIKENVNGGHRNNNW